MSKVKKVFAIILSMAMILGMSLTTFAAGSNKIVVNNLEEGSSVKAVQVIEPDQTTETGWDFVDNNDIKEAYVHALINDSAQVTPENCQKAIWMLLLAKNKNLADNAENLNISIPEDVIAATDEQIKNALDAISENSFTVLPDQDTTNQFTVTSAGVYAILATPKTGSSTVYSRMAAYVGFDYNEDGTPTLPTQDTQVNAKKSAVPVVKEVEDDDKATGISETVTYKVTTSVPYGVNTWKFTDTISNAAYVVEPESSGHKGQVKVSVKVGDANIAYEYATVSSDGKSFELDLTDYVTDDNYGKTVVLKYDATVTGLEVNNTIQYDDNHSSSQVKLYTGSIVLTKLDDEKNPNKLGGAGFKVSRVRDDDTEYAIFEEQADGTYQLKNWTTEIEDATEIFTEDNSKDIDFGMLTVTGLDVGDYHFTETTAPEGYTINEKGVTVNLTLGNGVTEATKAFSVNDDITDTKLSSLPLPSTGGMGTTIFTIGGCVIMIAAAGLYFASRRRQENK